MSRKKGPIAEKDLKSYPVRSYPYMVVRHPTGIQPVVYRTTFNEAVKLVKKDLTELAQRFQKLGVADVEAAAVHGLELVSKLPVGGGTIDIEIDPHTKTRYKVEIVRREVA